MDENKQDDKKINPSPSSKSERANKDILKWIIIGLAGFAVIVLVFSAGLFVGGMKAKFSYRWAENYHKNFGGPKGGFMEDWQKMMPFAPGDFIEGHGIFGEIIKINDSDLVIKGQGDMERVINITQNTIIKKGRMTIKKDELKVGDKIVVIGSPNKQGQTEAELIRIFDGESGKAPLFKKMPGVGFPPGTLSRR